MDAILSEIVKNPYGGKAKMFRILARNFGKIVDSLAVVKKEHTVFGKKKKYLFNPTVEIEMIGLNMKCKGKNITMFKEKYMYRTIKRSQYYKWSK